MIEGSSEASNELHQLAAPRVLTVDGPRSFLA